MTKCIYCHTESSLPVCIDCDDEHKRRILQKDNTPTDIFDVKVSESPRHGRFAPDIDEVIEKVYKEIKEGKYGNCRVPTWQQGHLRYL